MLSLSPAELWVTSASPLTLVILRNGVQAQSIDLAEPIRFILRAGAQVLLLSTTTLSIYDNQGSILATVPLSDGAALTIHDALVIPHLNRLVILADDHLLVFDLSSASSPTPSLFTRIATGCYQSLTCVQSRFLVIGSSQQLQFFDATSLDSFGSWHHNWGPVQLATPTRDSNDFLLVGSSTGQLRLFRFPPLSQ
jgi:hypothetical protein